jgi:hypothetical protein
MFSCNGFYNRDKKSAGNALLYVFVAVGLLGALTYSFVQSNRESYTVQDAIRIAQEMYVQTNLIKASILQCTVEYPEGGGDMDGDGSIDTDDNSNTPFPLEPSDALNDDAPAGCTTTGDAAGCVTQALDDYVRSLACVGAPIGSAHMFNGAGNSGAFLPPPPKGFGEWEYQA